VVELWAIVSCHKGNRRTVAKVLNNNTWIHDITGPPHSVSHDAIHPDACAGGLNPVGHFNQGLTYLALDFFRTVLGMLGLCKFIPWADGTW
jgi:hypothetical protein